MKYEIRPKEIALKEQESIQLHIYEVHDDGLEIEIPWDAIRFQDQGAGGAYISEKGLMTGIIHGTFQFFASIDTPEGSTEICAEYKVMAVENPKTINENFDEISPEKTEKEIAKDPPIRKTTLKKITVEELKSRVQEKKGKGFMAHSRAVIRTIDANADIVWLGIVILLSGVLGGILVLFLNGFTVEKIATFVSVFFASVFAFLKKIYSSPGEVSREIEEKMLGTNDQERLENLNKKRKEIDGRIGRLTTKIRNVDVVQPKSFYKLTMDEAR